MRKTMTWVILLLLAAGTAAGMWSYHVWNHSDLLLRETLLARLTTMFPGWNFSIVRTRFDFQGRIHAYGVRLTTGEREERFVDADEVILSIDGGRLADPEPLIRRIEIVRPTIRLTRDPEGHWNWEQLPKVQLPGGMLPEWQSDRMTLTARIERPDGAEPLIQELSGGAFQLIPAGRREYKARISGRPGIAEVARLEGKWHLDAKSWEVRGELGRLQVDDVLITTVSEFSPEFREGLDRWVRLARAKFRPPLAEGVETDLEFEDSPLGVSLTSDVVFRLSQSSLGMPLDYSASLQLLDGQITNPPVDFPLTALRGSASFDARQILVENFRAQSGGVGIELRSGRIERQDDLRPARFEVQVSELPLDDRVVALLPASARKLYLESRPTGRVDVQATLETDGRSPWKIEWSINPRDCTARHVDFPYLAEGIEGEVSQRDGIIRVALKGFAGRQPIRMSGETVNPGPEAESSYEITVDGVPIDARLREASPPTLRKVIDALQVTGSIGGRVLLKRPAGLKQPTVPYVDVTLRGGTLLPRSFPYSLTKATARVRGSGNTWRFTGCKGWHDRTLVTGSGAFQPDDGQVPRLSMKFSLEDLRFDRALYEALPDDFRGLWYEINPEGNCHVDGTLDWAPSENRKPTIHLDSELIDASVALRSFPYPIRNIHAWVSLAPGRVTIREFEGRHDETRLRAEAVATIADDGEWRFRFEPLFVDDLDPGISFRRALPGTLRSVIDSFDLRGDVSLSGMFELRGVRGDDCPVTAAWNLTSVYTGASMTAGVELKEMHGRSHFTGTWDGEAVRGSGKIALDSVKALGYQLQDVQGPVRIDDQKLVLGSRAVLEQQGAVTEIPDGERLTARFIEGVLAMDALIRLGEPMRYDVRVGLRNGELQRYAQLYMSGGSKLAGVINGVMYLSGQGTDFRQLKGNGRLVIEPAALYELPLLIAIFRVLSLQPLDNTAFNRAQFDFSVRNGLVLFDRMNLQGDSISMVGTGTVRMNDKRVNLDFYSAGGRKQLPIPIVREVTNELSKGWVGVHVEGTLRDPRPTTRPVPVLDDALKKLLGVFDMRPAVRRP